MRCFNISLCSVVLRFSREAFVDPPRAVPPPIIEMDENPPPEPIRVTEHITNASHEYWILLSTSSPSHCSVALAWTLTDRCLFASPGRTRNRTRMKRSRHRPSWSNRCCFWCPNNLNQRWSRSSNEANRCSATRVLAMILNIHHHCTVDRLTSERIEFPFPCTMRRCGSTDPICRMNDPNGWRKWSLRSFVGHSDRYQTTRMSHRIHPVSLLMFEVAFFQNATRAQLNVTFLQRSCSAQR